MVNQKAAAPSNIQHRQFSARQVRGRWLQWVRSLFLLGVICVLPFASGVALTTHLEESYIVGYFTVLSVVTYGCYWKDKRSAQAGLWRTPESTLHLLELLGGWPAAFVAQRILRHKIMKKSYQTVFWMIVILHQALAYDSFLGWRWVRLGYAWLQVFNQKP